VRANPVYNCPLQKHSPHYKHSSPSPCVLLPSVTLSVNHISTLSVSLSLCLFLSFVRLFRCFSSSFFFTFLSLLLFLSFLYISSCFHVYHSFLSSSLCLTFVFCFSSSFSVFLFSLSLILSNHSSLGQHLLKRVCKAQMCFVNFHFRQHRKKPFVVFTSNTLA